MKKLILKNSSKLLVEAKIQLLEVKHIDEILKLQHNVLDLIYDKEIFALTTKEEFIQCITSLGAVVGVIDESTSDIIAICMYIKYGYDENNYGYDLELEGYELLQVGQIETIIVSKDYRGNNLQNILCKYIEKLAKEDKVNKLGATVSPKNSHSLNNFLKLGYSIEKEKLKYGGYNRYILVKNL